MTKKRSTRSRDGATLSDALPSAQKHKLQELRDRLPQSAPAPVESQREKPPSPSERPSRPIVPGYPAGVEPKASTSPRASSGSSSSSAIKNLPSHPRSSSTKQPQRPVSKPNLMPPPTLLRLPQVVTQPKPMPVKPLDQRQNKSRGSAVSRDPKLPVAAPQRSSMTPKELAGTPRESRFWAFPGEAPVQQPPPLKCSESERSDFERQLRSGTGSPLASGVELPVVLGLDFGTSSTKLVVRLPFESGEPTLAVPAPFVCRVDGNPYLWQTVLWLQETGAFCPWPLARAAVLRTLKQGLIQGNVEKEISELPAGLEVSRVQAGVAYLAFVIRYAKGWLLRNRPGLFRRRRPVWLVNLGMPAASYDDPVLVPPFRQIGAAALHLANFDGPITVESVRRLLDKPQILSSAESEELGVSVIPEAAAVMTGFARSTRGNPGLYLMVDVGAMTLDACTFRLHQDSGLDDRYIFMAAQVRPLGVDSHRWFRDQGKPTAEFVGQCNLTIRSVVSYTNSTRDPNDGSWKAGGELPVFLTGGGAKNDLHRNVVESLEPWLISRTGNSGIRLLDLPAPRSLDCPEPISDFGRLAVAWGLSYPPDQIGKIEPMSEIEDILPTTAVDWRDGYVSKDQV